MTNTTSTLALINGLRNRGIYNVRVVDALDCGVALQVWFYDHNRRTMVLTDPIDCDEACELLDNLPKRRQRMMVRAYAL